MKTPRPSLRKDGAEKFVNPWLQAERVYIWRPFWS